MTRIRLDEALVLRGLYSTRSRARDAILRGTVRVQNQVILKPSIAVEEEAAISVEDPAQRYVSRAAIKLVHALDYFSLSPKGLLCLDIGASTGGFTQVLLERGAKHVTAVDVGHNQMASQIARNPRVTSIEGLNGRELSLEHIGNAPQFITCDSSFISLKLVLVQALKLAAKGALLVALIKPQFEVGKETVGRTGIVNDPKLHQDVCDSIEKWLSEMQWSVKGIISSPMQGGDGNKEFLIAAERLS